MLVKQHDVRTWPYFAIDIPVNEEGYGPVNYDAADKVKWHVWDHSGGTHGSYDYLSDAQNKAFELSCPHFGRNFVEYPDKSLSVAGQKRTLMVKLVSWLVNFCPNVMFYPSNSFVSIGQRMVSMSMVDAKNAPSALKVASVAMACAVGRELPMGEKARIELDGVRDGKEDIGSFIVNVRHKPTTDEDAENCGIMTIEEARAVAASVWTRQNNSDKEMDIELAEEFAQILLRQSIIQCSM